MLFASSIKEIRKWENKAIREKAEAEIRFILKENNGIEDFEVDASFVEYLDGGVILFEDFDDIHKDYEFENAVTGKFKVNIKQTVDMAEFVAKEDDVIHGAHCTSSLSYGFYISKGLLTNSPELGEALKLYDIE